MIVCDQQREENYLEFIRLRNNHDYYDVTFDDKSGGMSAIHRGHRFDKEVGPFGYPRGNYERLALKALREHGHSVVLLSEQQSLLNEKHCDALFDGAYAEIKAVETNGPWTIRRKLSQAEKQGASIILLFFPLAALFNRERVKNGYLRYIEDTKHYRGLIQEAICIAEDNLFYIRKPSG